MIKIFYMNFSLSYNLSILCGSSVLYMERVIKIDFVNNTIPGLSLILLLEINNK